MSDRTKRNFMVEVSVSDAQRTVTAPNQVLATKFLAVCAANNINSNADLDAALQGIGSLAGWKAILVALIEGMFDVGPP